MRKLPINKIKQNSISMKSNRDETDRSAGAGIVKTTREEKLYFSSKMIKAYQFEKQKEIVRMQKASESEFDKQKALFQQQIEHLQQKTQ